METKNHKEKKIILQDVRFAVRQVVCLYVAAMAILLPLLFNNNYVDIGTNKYAVYVTLTCIAGIATAGFILFRVVAQSIKAKKPILPKITLSKADKCVLVFFVVNIVACLLSSNPLLSFTGSRNRKTGLLFTIFLTCTYFMASRVPECKPYAVVGLLLSGLIVSLMGVLNFFGFDPFHMYVNLVPTEYEIFISFIGNRNFFAAFLCLYLPICIGLCMFWIPEWREGRPNTVNILGVNSSPRMTSAMYRLIDVTAWLGVPMGFAAVIAGRSDSAFAGLAIALVVLFIISLRSWKEISRFLWICVCMVLALVIMQPIYAACIANALEMPESISGDLLMGGSYIGLLLMLGALSVLASTALRKNASTRILNIIHQISIALIVLGALYVLVPFIYFTFLDTTTNLSGASAFFRIDDHWGNHRGYIWRRCFMRFDGYSFIEKLVGYGPDMLTPALAEYRVEMMQITGRPFDNAHNEYIQYLMTTGILGLGSYITLLSTTIYSLSGAFRRNARAAGPLLLPLVAYMVQAAFNLNQSTTTPLFFMLLGLIEGYLRNEENTI